MYAIHGGNHMKLGRNEPCHCGSGKKYKHCHYEEDRKAESKRLADEAAARAEAAKENAESADDGTQGSKHGKGGHDAGSGHHMRNTAKGGRSGVAGGGATSSRATRGAQRGG